MVEQIAAAAYRTLTGELSGVLHLHGEPLAQDRQGCLDFLGFGFMRGIEHTANHAFIDVQASREFGIIGVLVPHGR